MFKGTRMIVITKKNLIQVTSLLTLLTIAVIVFKVASSSISITAFSNYEEILDSRLSPSKNEDKIKEGIAKIKSNAEKIPDKILEHFLLIQEKKPADTTEEKENIVKEEEKELITSESKTVDKGLQVSNATSYNISPQEFINEPLCFSLDKEGPQILIIHTHTTESYSEDYYPKDAPDRNLDEEKNITAVGEAMAEVFNKNGIEVYHDKTVHDYPSYNGAYQRAAITIRDDLEAYKGIKVVLDVHRDGITKDDGTKVKLVTDIDGMPTAQVMLVVGTDSNLTHDNWKENFKFASKIQQKGIEMFPSLMRPIDLRQERFNEQMTNGSLIVEIGTNGNTLAEAMAGGMDIAEIISSVLKE